MSGGGTNASGTDASTVDRGVTAARPVVGRTRVRPVLTCVLVAALVAGASACGGAGSSGRSAPAATVGATPSTTAANAPSATDPGTLPQTMARPALDAAFHARIEALWKAIVDDRPEDAIGSFFPLAAYVQVKATRYPAADWQGRLVDSYDSIIHRLHRQIAGSTVVHPDVSVPEGKAVWVDPGVEHNKIGYWRVYHSLVTAGSSGFTIATMISWRGAWYVVHLAKVG
ncbi:MAG: hypothetical protein JWN46_3210 [Acidimicrobiales bacterium]|nr:hypothetical protein [Acidimicrobiales bacterium]